MEKKDILKLWVRRVMINRRMYGYLVDYYWRIQMICFDVPEIAFPILSLIMTIIQMQTNDQRLLYVITGVSGASTILGLISKVMKIDNKVSMSRHLKMEYDKLGIEIEMIVSAGKEITDQKLAKIETRIESIMYKDDGLLVPERVQEYFMSNQKKLVHDFYNTDLEKIMVGDMSSHVNSLTNP
jgi:membrane protease subunit (stomatin/prohibitin family)